MKAIFKRYSSAAIAICYIVTTLGLFSLSASTVGAVDPCTGSDTYVCRTSASDLTGGILKNVINVLLYVAGTIAVIVMIVGGIRYITSDGDPSKASQAKNTIIYALVGIVVAVMSYSLVNFIIGRL